MHTFILSRLDHCNALFTGLSKHSIGRLQVIQNSAARVLTGTRKHHHITPILKSLHWLPIQHRIHFKIILLVFKALHGSAHQYIFDLLTDYPPPPDLRPLRSSDSGFLVVPRIGSGSQDLIKVHSLTVDLPSGMLCLMSCNL